MRCPFCGHDETQVKDSRPSDDNNSIRRRRQCPACAARFTTFERVQLRDLMVIKKDESRVIFDREKLVRSIGVSCRKRPVKSQQIELISNSLLYESKDLESNMTLSDFKNYLERLNLDQLRTMSKEFIL